MSVGNLKDYGNKGNNFPWQLKMLQGLQAMIDGNCCAETLEILTSIDKSLFNIDKSLQPQGRTVKVTSTSTSGTTDSGAYSVSIANVGAAAGTVQGQPLPAGVTLNFDSGVLNNTFDVIPFDATGTTFLITIILPA